MRIHKSSLRAAAKQSRHSWIAASAFGLLAMTLLLCLPASAAIEKIACQSDTCWWPVLPEIAGWHHDHEYGIENEINALFPDEGNSDGGDAIIYAKAFPKTLKPGLLSVNDFIIADKKWMERPEYNALAEEVEPIKTGDGQVLRALLFTHQKTDAQDKIAYGEETDEEGNGYYLVFTLSAPTKAELERNMSTFERLIRNYKK